MKKGETKPRLNCPICDAEVTADELVRYQGQCKKCREFAIFGYNEGDPEEDIREDLDYDDELFNE